MKTIKISENITFLRKQAGITQEDLANKLNVSNQAVSKWEAGKCCPDIELLPVLASLFEISIDKLLLGECSVKEKTCTETNDTLLLQAIKLAQKEGQIYTSLLQRHLNIGYHQAKKLIDDMCKCGYITQDINSDSYMYKSNIG